MGIIALIEQFARRLERCTTLAEVAAVLGDAARELSFEFFAITFCDNLRQTAPRFSHLDNYPAVYAEVFIAKKLYRIDPMLHLAQRRIGGIPWDRVGDYYPLQSSHNDLLKRAAREGLRDGYTVPANIPGEPCGAISFASRRVRKLTPERRFGADSIGRMAFEATRRLRGLSAEPVSAPYLNAREVETVRHLAMGEIDKQIARALGISPDTVRQYVKMARATYGATTRAHLVAKALRDSQILFDEDLLSEESIPPSG